MRRLPMGVLLALVMVMHPVIACRAVVRAARHTWGRRA